MARILIIDDEAQMRELVATVLGELGHVVTGAANGEEGLRSHREQPVDLVITDIVMPEMDGLRFVRTFRVAAPEVPLIVISGNPSSDSFLQTARLLGPHCVLTKPFPLVQLVQLVQSMLEQRSGR